MTDQKIEGRIPSSAAKQTGKTTHLVHTDSLPEDSVKVNSYGTHSFDNLYSVHPRSSNN